MIPDKVTIEKRGSLYILEIFQNDERVFYRNCNSYNEAVEALIEWGGAA